MKTVRVRIAVAVTQSGDWSAYGDAVTTSDKDKGIIADENLWSDDDRSAVHFVEADIPLPEAETVEGEVKS